MAHLTLQYFLTLSHKQHDFGKTFIEPKMFVLILSTLFETFTILRRIERDMVTDLYLYEYEVPIIC